MIPASGLKLRKEYEKFDIEEMMPLDINIIEENDLMYLRRYSQGIKDSRQIVLFLQKYVFRKIRPEHVWFQMKELVIHGINTEINE